jgi:hypothetical protein
VTLLQKSPLLQRAFFIITNVFVYPNDLLSITKGTTQRLGAAFGERHNRPGLLGHLLHRRGYVPVANNERGSTRDFVVSDFSERTPGCD